MVYKGIEHERLGDAPFIGALIIANDCKGNCSGCFNQHVKNEPTLNNTSEEIIAEVLKNPLNQGIILGGLEWSDQPRDMLSLIVEAKLMSLEVIVYTRLTQSVFEQLYPTIIELGPIYVKYGMYDETLRNNNYYSMGVKLATTNQYIIYYDEQI